MRSATVNGKRLRELREERELTLKQLAAIAGLDHSTIHKIEVGTRQPNARTFGALCRALRVPRTELLVQDSQPKQMVDTEAEPAA